MPIIEARAVHQAFPISGGGAASKPRVLRAVRGVDLTLGSGEALALVGESGCGKSTLAKMLLGLSRPSGGEIFIGGDDVVSLSRKEVARRVQPVFQDPFVSLNPRKTIEQIVSLPLAATGNGGRAERRERVRAMLDLVGLPSEFCTRMPAQLSGGQRQRVSIARALVGEPRALICDEPTSALDVSVQAQILNLLQDLRDRLGLSYLVITHNLAVVDHLAERTAVMYFGRIVEEGPTRAVLTAPRHPYTLMLRQAVLEPDTSHQLAEYSDPGVMPSPMEIHTGCPFRARCARATEICNSVEPDGIRDGDRIVACHNPLPSQRPFLTRS
ncbi:ABC transporter ATP-binding protein [Microvirga sp. BT350]|uniref:ABC transporter ATP-binding protein n=2 Tax=Microvirga alba TaxID=2791025 RepID=A0A931BZ62_9HYPH|nr:ABC transporter ATP-binding protein [Microvirga alba]